MKGPSAGIWPRSPGTGGGLQGWAGRFGLPEAVVAEQRIEQAGGPAHDGHLSHLVGLPRAMRRRKRAWEPDSQRIADRVAMERTRRELARPPTCRPESRSLGGQAQQRGRVAATGRAELGHVGEQAGCREATAAGDRPDAVGAAREDSVCGDAGLVGLPGCGGALGGLRIEFGSELAEGAELVEELAAESEQVAELPEVLRPGRGRRKVVEQAEASQDAGIHAVVLRQPAEGFGEAPRAQRIDQDGFDADISEALVEVAVAAPGRPKDGAGHAVPKQPIAHDAAAALVVPEHTIDAAIEEVDVELRLADISAGDYDGAGFVHSCVPVLS
ncbi:MAG: hypothetical protein OXN97_11070 [Bryobacterales bacterium]|nr:hypothetical protein [Bryobacterales bacterium]